MSEIQMSEIQTKSCPLWLCLNSRYSGFWNYTLTVWNLNCPALNCPSAQIFTLDQGFPTFESLWSTLQWMGRKSFILRSKFHDYYKIWKYENFWSLQQRLRTIIALDSKPQKSKSHVSSKQMHFLIDKKWLWFNYFTITT